MKNSFGRLFACLIVVIVLFSFAVTANASGYYVHDPMANPKAAADIVEDPNAVYGYAPNPDSQRLGVFAAYDWSDEAFVAQMKQEREEYHESVKELYQIKAEMEAQGKSVEEIARAVSTRRNEIRMEFYKDDPKGLEDLKQSNLQSFGNENGGTPEYFYNKYGSWEKVIEKTFSTNAGADACLGLYDQYYDTYIIENVPNDGDDRDAEKETVDPSATEPTEKPGNNPAATADSSLKSPKTGDRSIMLILLIVVMSGVAVISVIALKNCREE